MSFAGQLILDTHPNFTGLNSCSMIHKQFDYKSKLVWAALFLILFFSTASSVIKQRQANKKGDIESASIQTVGYEFSVINFLNEGD